MLALEGLRQEIASRSGQGASAEANDWWSALWGTTLRRRDVFWLGLTSGALAPRVTSAASGPLRVAAHGDRFSLELPGQAAWAVDPSYFDGPARVRWTADDDTFSVELSDARLPCFGIACAFVLRGRRERGSWHATFEFPAWGAVADVPLEGWLAGEANAVARAVLPPSDGGCAGFEAWVQGRAALSFSRDWVFGFEGRTLVELRSNGASAGCDRVAFKLLAPASGRLYEGPAARRMLASFAGPRLAKLMPEVDGHELRGASQRVEAEFVRRVEGTQVVATLWARDGEGAALGVSVGGGDTVSLDLDSYRVTQLHGDGPSECALFAGIAQGPHWVDAQMASVQVAAGEGSRISVVASDGTCEKKCAELATPRFVVPFVGADVACFIERAASQKGGEVEFKDTFSLFRGESIDLDGYDFAVARTADGFGGTFRFNGLELRQRRGRWYLAPRTAHPKLEFELASQHLNEEAIFSASRPGKSRVSQEAICGPFGDERARFMAYVALRACEVWPLKPAANALDREVNAVLRRFVANLRADAETRWQDWLTLEGLKPSESPWSADLQLLDKVNNATALPLPPAFSKFLTQEYLAPMERIRNPPDPTQIPVQVVEAANKERRLKDLEPKEFAAWYPRAVDAQPSRVAFKLTFRNRVEVPFDLRTLMAWASKEDGVSGLEFEELLSPRALAPDAEIEVQKQYASQNGNAIPSLGNDGSVNTATALELPYRLTISPVPLAVKKPVANDKSVSDLTSKVLGSPADWSMSPPPTRVWGERLQLWHLRMGAPRGAPLPMRALHSPDFLANSFFQPPRPYSGGSAVRASLDAHDRHNLVALTSGYGQTALLGSEHVVAMSAHGAASNTPPETGIFVPKPFHAGRLILTPLGASFDLLGAWDPPGTTDGALTVSKWDHHARLRRDAEVTVEYRGFLLPLGVPAVFLKRTTREFKRADGGSASYRAVLVQRYSIRVEDKPYEFPREFHPYAGRDWCFRSTRVFPLETPPLLPPENTTESQICGLGRQGFWPMVPSSDTATTCANGRLFEFTVVERDRAFTAPLVFVDNEVAHTPSKLRKVLLEYRCEVEKRRFQLLDAPAGKFGAEKALARMVRGELEFLPGAGSRNTRHVTKWFVLGVRVPAPPKGSPHTTPSAEDPSALDIQKADVAFNAAREARKEPPFYPRVSQALVESQLLAGLSGNPIQRNNFSYHETFVEKAFHEVDNAGGVLLKIVDPGGAPMAFGGNTAASGGVMAPSASYVAIARDHGPVAGAPAERPIPAKLDGNCAPCEVQTSGGAKPVVVALGGSSASADPVARFMKGISDPVEYFAQMLSDAKLLGCVRLADVIKTVLQVSGTQVPRITQQEIFDGVVDALKPVLLSASGVIKGLEDLRKLLERDDAPPALRLKVAPVLRAAVESLSQAKAAVLADPVDPALVASHVGAAFGHLRQCADVFEQAAQNPVALLPPAVGDVIAKAQAIHKTLQATWKEVQRLPDIARGQLLEAFRAEVSALVVAATDAAKKVPEFATVAEWVARLEVEGQALGKAIRDMALQEAARALGKVQEVAEQLRAWAELVDGKGRDLYAVATGKLSEILVPLRQDATSLQGAIQEMIESSTEGLVAVLQKLDKLHSDLLRLSKPEIANGVQEAMRDVVQLREQLFALHAFIGNIEGGTTLLSGRALGTPTNSVQHALDYLRKADANLRKTGELWLNDVERRKALIAAGLQQVDADVGLDSLLRLQSAFLATCKLSKSLKAFQDALPAKMEPPLEALRAELAKALKDALEVADAAERGPSELQNLLKSRRAALLDGLEKQAGLLVARALDEAGPVLKAVKDWEKRAKSVESELAKSVGIACAAVAQLASLDLPDPRKEGSPLSREVVERLDRLGQQVRGLSKACANVNTFEAATTGVRQVLQLGAEVGSLFNYVADAVKGGNVAALVDQRMVIEQVLQKIGVPTRLRIGYDWKTEIQDYPRGGGAVFRPLQGEGRGAGGAPQLSLNTSTEVDLRNGVPPATLITGQVDAFDLHLFGTAPFLIVELAPITFTAGTGRPLKLDVKVKDVRFGKSLQFVQDLASYLASDSGFYFDPIFQPPGIEIGYRFNRDILQLAAVTLQNVSLSIAVILPFDNKPARFRIGVGSRQKPVLASVGIYGGGFFVGLTLRADAMELLEASMEYGLVTGVSFGVLTGTAKVTAGIYISLGATDEIRGFFCARGAFTIAVIFGASASLTVSLSAAKDKMRGDAEFVFEFSIGFIDYSYSVSVSYEKGGGGDTEKDANGEQAPQKSATKSAISLGLAALPRGGTPTVSATQKHLVEIREEAHSLGNPKRLSPGLADDTVWRTYWQAFADLDGESTSMCVS